MSEHNSAPAIVAISHRSVLAIAVPIMLSNVSAPLIGVVNTAVIGRLPEPYYIGAISVASVIFSFIFWGFGFLRLSTGGLTAQAVGRGDGKEVAAVLIRALLIALAAGLGLLLLAPLIRELTFAFMGGSADVQAHGKIYFNLRIWSAPFALANYCILGWFVGQAQAGLAFAVQLFLNLTNLALSMLFVLVLGMTSDGVGLAALLAEIAAALAGGVMTWTVLRRMPGAIDWPLIRNARKLKATMMMNADVMVRTLCLLFAFSWFASRGARSGDITLAANVVLLHFFDVSAYLIDGFAYASEALVGQSVGAKDRARFRAAVRITSLWAMAVGIVCALVLWFGGPWIIDLMTVSQAVRAEARLYLPWLVLTPVLGVVCFQFDGIFTGAMATRDIRNMMMLSLAVYMLAWWLLEARFGNHGLWAALNIFFVARGLTFASRMPAIERRLFAQA